MRPLMCALPVATALGWFQLLLLPGTPQGLEVLYVPKGLEARLPLLRQSPLLRRIARLTQGGGVACQVGSR